MVKLGAEKLVNNSTEKVNAKDENTAPKRKRESKTGLELMFASSDSDDSTPIGRQPRFKPKPPPKHKPGVSAPVVAEPVVADAPDPYEEYQDYEENRDPNEDENTSEESYNSDDRYESENDHSSGDE